MTQISDVANVTVNIADTRITRTGFGTILIFDTILSSVFSGRVKQYPNIEAIAVDFDVDTKVYRAATAIFSQTRAPTFIKVGRHESGDASITAALDLIQAEDSDFYCVVSPLNSSANIQLISAWVETKFKIYLAENSDADVITSVTTDVASLLQASSYNRTGYMWHHQTVNDVTAASYTVTSGVATVTDALHGLRVGDPVTLLNSSGNSIDGVANVATVPTDGTYTIVTTALDEAGPDTVDYSSGYNFPEAAWAGYMLPSDPGSETWKFKQLAGIQITQTSHLSPSAEALALGKNANLYTNLAGVGHTQQGTMASGRFIDIQRGTDWIEARIEEAIVTLLLNQPKIPYSDAGFTAFYAEIAQVLEQGVQNNVLAALLDNSGDFYRIVIPKASAQSVTDRQNRYLPGITAEVQLAGAVHSTLITVNAKV